MTSQQTQRRIRAARALAGFDSVDDLAAHVDMGATTLRKMERGERPVRPRELREIAEACGLPYEFFTEDFERLGAGPAEGVEDRLSALEEAVSLLADPGVRDAERTQALERWRRQGASHPGAGAPAVRILEEG